MWNELALLSGTQSSLGQVSRSCSPAQIWGVKGGHQGDAESLHKTGELDAITARWQVEKDRLEASKQTKRELDEALTALGKAKRESDWNRW